MFYTFLKFHKDFQVDLLLLHNDLTEKNKEELKVLFGVKCIEIDLNLKEKLSWLTEAIPKYKNREARFYSLEAFNLNYDSILFVDSDVIFRKSVAELFDLENPFSACLDFHSMQGRKRSLETFSTDLGDSAKPTFNAGLFHFRPNKLEAKIYEKLIDSISVDQFVKLKSGHTDQFILNQEFANSVNLLDSNYNTFVTPQSEFEQTQKLESAAIWHFLRHPKPWKQKAWIKGFFKGNKVPVQVKIWNQLFHQFSKEMKRKMTWQEKVLNTIILLISSRD
jgi:lipopolysaccharide biosynthesis glycosyltransferase